IEPSCRLALKSEECPSGLFFPDPYFPRRSDVHARAPGMGCSPSRPRGGYAVRSRSMLRARFHDARRRSPRALGLDPFRAWHRPEFLTGLAVIRCEEEEIAGSSKVRGIRGTDPRIDVRDHERPRLRAVAPPDLVPVDVVARREDEDTFDVPQRRRRGADRSRP